MVRSHYWKMRQSWSVTNWNDLKNQNLSLNKINNDFAFLYFFWPICIWQDSDWLMIDFFDTDWLGKSISSLQRRTNFIFILFYFNCKLFMYLISNANLFKQIFLVLEPNVPHFFTFLYKKLQLLQLLATPSYW